MKYVDRVYGQWNIDEPIVLELIGSKALQRLKGVDQAGYRPLWVKPGVQTGEFDHSRFAHSIGVYLLLKKYGAPIEEQLAGLIHDVSHSAFSHCVDYALDAGSEKNQSHQDNIFQEYVKSTEIPGILKQYGFNVDYILDDRNFPLKEKDLPDLCADRIDYSFREAVIFGEVDQMEKDRLIGNLAVEKGDWFFSDYDNAKKYAELFFTMNASYFSGLNSAIMFRAVGDCLRHALRMGYITEHDLYQTDNYVINKIKEQAEKDNKLRLLFDRMNDREVMVNDKKDYDAIVFCKSRVVDPLFKCNEGLKRLSQADPGWGDVVRGESAPKQYFLKFLK